MRLKPAPPDQLGAARCEAQGKSGDQSHHIAVARSIGSSWWRRVELILVLALTLAITSAISHAVVKSLRIRLSGVGYKILGTNGQPPTAIAEGSSLMRDAISWQQ